MMKLMMMMTMSKCRDCVYFEGCVDEDEFDFCRRYPPITIWNTVTNETDYEFPIVSADHDWCGEFKQRISEI